MENIDKEEYVADHKWWQEKKYFFRQLLICTGAWTCYFIMGISIGSSTVIIPQIRAEANSTDAVSEEVASWIRKSNSFIVVKSTESLARAGQEEATIQIYAAIPWSLILPLLAKIFGRKYTFFFVSITNLISFIVLWYSNTVTQIIISEIINGVNTGSHFTVAVLIVTEYTSPKYRGFFLTAKTATAFWGILASNAIGTFFHWKNIALVGIACSIYSIVLSFILPESPYWLNMKHRVDKCSKVHRWLIGTDKQSEKDLGQLINYKKEINMDTKNKQFVIKDFTLKYIKIMSSKQFYKPLLLSILVQSSYVFSGKIVFSVYVIDIIRKVTADQEMSAYTGMLILDGATVMCMYVGCVLANMCSRRKLLISTTLLGILFLVSISVYIYSIKLNALPANNFISIALLTGYSMAIACGSLILSPAISGELISLEYRALSSCFIDLCLKINLGTLVKVIPYLLKSLGPEGVFLFFAVASLIVLILIYKYLPETKDKTLQDIAKDLFKGSNKKPVLKEEARFLADSEKIVD